MCVCVCLQACPELWDHLLRNRMWIVAHVINLTQEWRISKPWSSLSFSMCLKKKSKQRFIKPTELGSFSFWPHNVFWTTKYKTRAKNMKCKQAWKRQPVCSAYKAVSSVMCNIFGSVCTLHCFLSKMSFLGCTLISKVWNLTVKTHARRSVTSEKLKAHQSWMP